MSDLGLAHPPDLRYCDGDDNALFVASFYIGHNTMSVTIPDPRPSSKAPACLPVDLVFDQAIQAVHRHEARAQQAQQIFGAPFVYNLDATASFSGLPVHLLRRLCRSGELQAVPLFGRWLLHRDEFNRLLAPDVTLRSRAARQYVFLRNLQQLAAMLRSGEAEATISVLLKDLRRATMFRQYDAAYDEAGSFAWHRAKWRVRDGIVDTDQTEEALRLVQAIIELGMQLLRNIDWRDGNSRLVSMIAEQTGVDLAI